MAIATNKLPHNQSIEKNTLGLMIYSISSCSEGLSRLGEDDFYDKENKIVFNAILNLNSQGRKIDIETVIEELKNMKSFDSIGGFPYIQELIDSVISESSISEYIDILKENTNLRKMLILLGEIENEYLYQKIENKNSFLASIQARINKIADMRKISNFETSSEIAQKYRTQIDDLILNRKNRELTGLDTGFKLLNYHTDGLQNQNLVIVAGRTGTGKTTFALNLMLNAAMKEKRPVAIFEMEMSSTSLYMRLTANQSGIDSQKLQKGRDLTVEDKLSIKQTIDTLEKLDIYVDESATTTIYDIQSKARKLKQERPDLAMIVIDHLGIISSDNKKNKKFDSRQLEIQEYTRLLHELARELNIPIVLICQLNRKATEREGSPKLADLRESGSIEMDAELVLLLHREDYEKNDYDTMLQTKKVTAANMSADSRKEMLDNINKKAAEEAGVSKEDLDKHKTTIMHVIIAKNRNGQSDTNVELVYKKNIFKFEDVRKEVYEKKNEIKSKFIS